MQLQAILVMCGDESRAYRTLNMHYIYILRSLRNKDFYIAYISDLKRRLIEHKSDRSHHNTIPSPWRLNPSHNPLSWRNAAGSSENRFLTTKNSRSYCEERKTVCSRTCGHCSRNGVVRWVLIHREYHNQDGDVWSRERTSKLGAPRLRRLKEGLRHTLKV